MKHKNFYATIFGILTVAFSVFCLSGCSPTLKVNIAENGEITFDLYAPVEQEMAETVRSFSGAATNISLFNKQQIQESLAKVGFAKISVELPDSNSLQIIGELNYKNKDNVLLPAIPKAIIFEAGSTKKAVSELKLTLSQTTLNQIVSFLPLETAEYMELLSAPVFTGETMLPTEYIDLISAIYGESTANVLAKSLVTIEVTAPKKIIFAEINSSANNVKTSGTKAEFFIPVVELLTQTESIELLVRF